MKTHDFYYALPPELIAQTPIQRRDASRLMTLNKETGELGHYHFYDLPQFLKPGDCLVLNDSRVLPARLLGQREPTGGACEVVLLIDRGRQRLGVSGPPREETANRGQALLRPRGLAGGNHRSVREWQSAHPLLLRRNLSGDPGTPGKDAAAPPISKRNCRMGSGTRPSTPKRLVPPPPLRQGCTSRKHSWSRSKPWG